MNVNNGVLTRRYLTRCRLSSARNRLLSTCVNAHRLTVRKVEYAVIPNIYIAVECLD